MLLSHCQMHMCLRAKSGLSIARLSSPLFLFFFFFFIIFFFALPQRDPLSFRRFLAEAMFPPPCFCRFYPGKAPSFSRSSVSARAVKTSETGCGHLQAPPRSASWAAERILWVSNLGVPKGEKGFHGPFKRTGNPSFFFIVSSK